MKNPPPNLSGVPLHGYQQDIEINALRNRVETASDALSLFISSSSATTSLLTQDQIEAIGTFLYLAVTELQRIRIGIAEISGLNLEDF